MPKLPKFMFPVFLVLFFTAAPALIFFTAGYRLDLKSWQVTRVGIIIVDGEPARTSVFLNDKQVASRLPLKRKGVRPDYYTIKLQSEGYHDVVMQRDLRAGESLVISPVFLLQQSVPSLVRSSDVVSILPDTPANRFFIETQSIAGKQLWLYHVGDDSWTSLYTTDIVSDWDLSLNLDASLVLLRTRNTYRVISAEPHPVLPFAYRDVTWSPTNPRELYAIDIADRLIRFSTDDSTPLTAIANAYQLITLTKDDALVLYELDGVNQLISVSLHDDVDSKFLAEASDTSSLDSHAAALFVHDGHITVSQPDGLTPLLVYDNHRFIWKDSSQRVGYFVSEFEIVAWDVESHDIRTIVRYSGDIHAVTPVYGTKYMLIAQGDKLLAFNTAEFEHQTTVLLSDVAISDIESNEDGTAVVLSGTIDNQEGIFTLELRED